MKNFDEQLLELFDGMNNSKVKEAMLYSLSAGGKRIRPNLLFAALESYGLDPQIGFRCAAAIEMIHTYSLIHDDLPAMDNDTLRRGKPTCHIQFDEATAILAGDGLLTEAFRYGACACDDPAVNMQIVTEFVNAAGADGMILGQTLDLSAEEKEECSLEELETIHRAKTGKLLTLPLLCAAHLAHRSEDLAFWHEFGERLGFYFQIQDDILDLTATSEELGKSTSDLQNHKQTMATQLGIEEAKQQAERCYEQLNAEICSFAINPQPITAILNLLHHRRR